MKLCVLITTVFASALLAFPTATLADRAGRGRRSGGHQHHTVFVGGWWYGPPYYYGWGYTRPYYYDPGYQFSAPSSAAPNPSIPANVSPDYTTGFIWGTDLRVKLVREKDIWKTLKKLWPDATEAARADYRRGFQDAYGPAAEAQFDHLLAKAKLSPR